MVSPNGETQPQEVLQPVPGDDGAAKGTEQDTDAQLPQAAAETGGDQTGAEKAEVEETKKLTRSDDEYNKMQSSLQKQTATVKWELQELTRRMATDKVAATEAAAKATDARAVDEGEITQVEATQREKNRTDQVAANQQLTQTQVRTAELDARAEASAVIQVAEQFGKEHGFDPQLLLADPGARSDPFVMQAKAELFATQAALKKAEAALVGTETFDSSLVGGGATVSLTGMSPMEMAQLAYSDSETSKRNKNKRR